MTPNLQLVTAVGTVTPTSINIGCGVHPLDGWFNIDNDPSTPADKHISVPPLPFEDESVTDIFAGHYLEHLSREEAALFMSECYRCLKPGGRLGIVVPDMMEIMKRYVNQQLSAKMEFPRGVWHDMRDMDEICDIFIFSTIQDSPHKWAYDRNTLSRLMRVHKFEGIAEINGWMDPRIPVGSWYQFGEDCYKR